ncbi:uncharacterized protein N7496_008614 [Penicillium cataractarum]|uniref:Uncharacterized protein n=1 Tax=Penicillium cataractarum TaxID=2100454 RepID=A0A9W9S1E2_9EURO|nr:uncharacterized protein N7496_008614 [Penicillium cataractarum]KAJ5368854.1 hypothetical protein N7496_008614 [Penicillium cataractarum]
MFKALSRNPSMSGYAVSGVPSSADFGSMSLSPTTVVAITSVVTETVHPTLIITEVTTVGTSQLGTSLSAGQQQSEESPGPTIQAATVQTEASQTSQTQTVQLAYSTTSQLTVLSPETTATWSWSTADLVSSSSPAGQTSVSLPPVVGHSLGDGQTSSSELVPVLSSSTTSALSSTAFSTATTSSVLGATTTSLTATSTPTSRSTLVTSSLAETTFTSVSSHSSSSSPSLSPSSSSSAVITSGSESTNGQFSHSNSDSHLGAIVGGPIGGAVFVALALLACTLFRRRRRRAPTKPQGSPGGDLRPNSNDSLTTFRGVHGWHSQQNSQSEFLMDPVFSPRGNTVLSAPAPNQEVPNNTMYQARDSRRDHFSDPELSPVSPIINIHPPSRTASNYSQRSGDGGLKFLEKHDFHPSTPSSRYESIYYPDEGSFTPSLPEEDKLAPRDNRKTRLSTRSDPFDLEMPPKALHEWPLPPHPTPWGDKF